ncbi:MAG: hypothetical protein KGM24_04580 [Elusimicrobia bacterium]|nr:hypothetical protein [Elusimicrobiota bacterium]
MENEEKTEGGKCCGGKKHCCGCKAVAAIVLLGVGALGGYFAGRHCATTAPAAVSAPAK